MLRSALHSGIWCQISYDLFSQLCVTLVDLRISSGLKWSQETTGVNLTNLNKNSTRQCLYLVITFDTPEYHHFLQLSKNFQMSAIGNEDPELFQRYYNYEQLNFTTACAVNTVTVSPVRVIRI